MSGAKKKRTPKANLYLVTLGVFDSDQRIELLVRAHSSAQANRWLDENARTIQMLDADDVYEHATAGTPRFDATSAPQDLLDQADPNKPDANGMVGDETIDGEKTHHAPPGR